MHDEAMRAAQEALDAAVRLRVLIARHKSDALTAHEKSCTPCAMMSVTPPSSFDSEDFDDDEIIGGIVVGRRFSCMLPSLWRPEVARKGLTPWTQPAGERPRRRFCRQLLEVTVESARLLLISPNFEEEPRFNTAEDAEHLIAETNYATRLSHFRTMMMALADMLEECAYTRKLGLVRESDIKAAIDQDLAEPDIVEYDPENPLYTILDCLGTFVKSKMAGAVNDCRALLENPWDLPIDDQYEAGEFISEMMDKLVQKEDSDVKALRVVFEAFVNDAIFQATTQTCIQRALDRATEVKEQIIRLECIMRVTLAKCVRYTDLVEAAILNTRRVLKECLNVIEEDRSNVAFDDLWWKQRERFQGTYVNWLREKISAYFHHGRDDSETSLDDVLIGFERLRHHVREDLQVAQRMFDKIKGKRDETAFKLLQGQPDTSMGMQQNCNDAWTTSEYAVFQGQGAATDTEGNELASDETDDSEFLGSELSDDDDDNFFGDEADDDDDVIHPSAAIPNQVFEFSDDDQLADDEDDDDGEASDGERSRDHSVLFKSRPAAPRETVDAEAAERDEGDDIITHFKLDFSELVGGSSRDESDTSDAKPNEDVTTNTGDVIIDIDQDDCGKLSVGGESFVTCGGGSSRYVSPRSFQDPLLASPRPFHATPRPFLTAPHPSAAPLHRIEHPDPGSPVAVVIDEKSDDRAPDDVVIDMNDVAEDDDAGNYDDDGSLESSEETYTTGNFSSSDDDDCDIKFLDMPEGGNPERSVVRWVAGTHKAPAPSGAGEAGEGVGGGAWLDEPDEMSPLEQLKQYKLNVNWLRAMSTGFLPHKLSRIAKWVLWLCMAFWFVSTMTYLQVSWNPQTDTIIPISFVFAILSYPLVLEPIKCLLLTFIYFLSGEKPTFMNCPQYFRSNRRLVAKMSAIRPKRINLEYKSYQPCTHDIKYEMSGADFADTIYRLYCEQRAHRKFPPAYRRKLPVMCESDVELALEKVVWYKDVPEADRDEDREQPVEEDMMAVIAAAEQYETFQPMYAEPRPPPRKIKDPLRREKETPERPEMLLRRKPARACCLDPHECKTKAEKKHDKEKEPTVRLNRGRTPPVKRKPQRKPGQRTVRKEKEEKQERTPEGSVASIGDNRELIVEEHTKRVWCATATYAEGKPWFYKDEEEEEQHQQGGASGSDRNDGKNQLSGDGGRKKGK